MRGSQKLEREGEGERKGKMPAAWFFLKRTLHCKAEPADVHDPAARSQLLSVLVRKTGRSGCSRSLANLRDVVHGSKRQPERSPGSCSPRSIGSSELLHPIPHEVVLSNSRRELKITGFWSDGCGSAARHCSSSLRVPAPPSNKSPLLRSDWGPAVLGAKTRVSTGTEFHGSSGASCQRCGERFVTREAAEAHHISKHAVTELTEGDSSRKIVEIICRTGWPNAGNHRSLIDRVLKVHSLQKTIARFEDYRETVKARAGKLSKKHPRCLADGNELLRFHGTTLACSLGGVVSHLCSSESCGVCRIIRNGFASKKEILSGIGVFTASTSRRALESVEMGGGGGGGARRALVICRVIAGRVHRAVERREEMAGQSGFDSVAGKVGLHSNIEELYLLSPRALLPCFVVICKP